MFICNNLNTTKSVLFYIKLNEKVNLSQYYFLSGYTRSWLIQIIRVLWITYGILKAKEKTAYGEGVADKLEIDVKRVEKYAKMNLKELFDETSEER